MKTIEGYDVKIFTDNIDQKALERWDANLNFEKL